MKKLTLESMTLQNFKGISALTLDFSPASTRISGMNGTGKTTLPDAYSWILFNRDSRGNAPGSDNFHEKPLDDSGAEIHNLDTMVELKCTINGLPLNLRRLQRENWVKKRGNTDADFQGNVSQYWINDVEVKLSDFKARISEIAPEDVFRVIGMLGAFNALDWKERRKQLLAMTGDVSESLIARKDYEPLTMECARRGIDMDGLRKVMTDTRRNINRDLDMLPVRIDEARKALDDVSPAELQAAETTIADASAAMQTLDTQIRDLRANSAGAKIEREIVELESEQASLKRQIMTAHQRQREALQDTMESKRDALHRASLACKDIDQQLATRPSILDELKGRREVLREKYKTVFESQYAGSVSDTCPTCGQALPAEKVDAARRAVINAFKAERERRLLEIQAQGKDCANQIKEIEDRIAELEAEQTKALATEEFRKLEFDVAANALDQFPQSANYESEPRIAEIEARLTALRESSAVYPVDSVTALQAEMDALHAKSDAARAVIAKHGAAKTTTARIAQLERDQKTAASALADTEKLLTLIEKYVQDYCALLEESINELFPTLRWKLFDTQINGGISDTCICMVPCASGLIPYGTANTGSRMNADLEIINVLSAQYEVSLPVFADNCESVNKLRSTDAQMILLTVTTDTEMKIEEEQPNA